MKKKILLIEDDEMVRESTAAILEIAGFDVITADNGKAGVETCYECIPDLIICDIMMPGLDGYGVLYMLSKKKETTNIPFIFLTAKAERADMRKGMEMGADDYLTKPFEESELLATIETRLKKNITFNESFENTMEGIGKFIDEAKGVEALNKLTVDNHVESYRNGDTIYVEGNHPKGIFLIKKGKIKTYKINEDGKEFVTGLYSAGDFFGYLPILEDIVYSDYAMALDDLEIFQIPKEDFVALIYENRDVSCRLIKMLSNNLSEKEDQLIKLAYDTVRKKTTDCILKLVEKFYSDNKEIRLAIPRDDLASMAGTATESLIRALAGLKSENLIQVDEYSKEIIVTDLEGLKNIRW